MSQPAVAGDSFVPFDPVPPSGQKPVGSSGPLPGLRVVSKTEAGPAFTPLSMPGTSHPHTAGGAAGKPIITVQRDGELVTLIRVECACGQVIELACSYP